MLVIVLHARASVHRNDAGLYRGSCVSDPELTRDVRGRSKGEACGGGHGRYFGEQLNTEKIDDKIHEWGLV